MTRLGYQVRRSSDDAVSEVVEELLGTAHVAASALLAEHREFLTALAEALLDEETLTAADIRAIADLCGVTGHETVTVPPPPPRRTAA
jgi:ATP-dependent Zn protease